MLNNFSLKTPENTEELKELYKKKPTRLLHAARRVYQLVVSCARCGFRIDFYDFHDDCGNDAGTIRDRIFLVFPYRNRICRVGNLSRRVGYEEETRLAQNRFPNRQSKRHCVRNGNLPFISPNIRLRRAWSVDCHRNHRLCALSLEIQYIPQRVRHLFFCHRCAYACGILHGVLLADRHIRSHLFRVPCRACVLPSRSGRVRSAQKIRALHIPLFRACRSGAVFDCNVSSNHRQIKNLWQSNNLAHQQKYTAEK